MKVRATLIALVALLVAADVHAQSIVGVWKQFEIEVIGGSNAGTTSVTDHNTIWIITDGYHSLNAASAPGSERAQAADPRAGYTAFAGTYDSLDPAQAATMTREITVTPTTFETRATGDDGVLTIRRYERLE